jgi:hypothetical protein
VSPDANLESMVITTIVDDDRQARFLDVAFRDAPGFEMRLSRAAAIELRDFLNGLDCLRGSP